MGQPTEVYWQEARRDDEQQAWLARAGLAALCTIYCLG
ncbi:hypothetical protein SF83666_a44150 (plasmid) [Sinorhizobium fredii CCBAU 83666]|nr:hypothetical protein SF83666_a44150 [Sinorhizobium fredii CCBAU 83666]